MRIWIDLLAETEIGLLNRLPKPSARIIYSQDGDEADVFIRPSPGTALKCIGKFDARALIYEDGVLVIWHQNDMFHQDVYDHPELKRSADFLLLKLQCPGTYPVCVSVKGGADDEPIAYTDKGWLKVLHSNRTLTSIYGNDFPVDQENWW